MARRWVCQVKIVPEGGDVFYPDFPFSFPKPNGGYAMDTGDRMYWEFPRDLTGPEIAEMSKRGNRTHKAEGGFVPRAEKRRSDGVRNGKSIDGTTDLPPNET